MISTYKRINGHETIACRQISNSFINQLNLTIVINIPILNVRKKKHVHKLCEILEAIKHIVVDLVVNKESKM